MTLKMSGIRGKIGSSKEQAFKTFNLIRSLAKRHINSGPGICESQGSDAFNVQAHISGNQRVHEVETEKAFVIKVSHHDSWKAGGPV